jgi:hypothetical protein
MRDFLKDCFKQLKFWTGYAQAEKLNQEEAKELMDVMVMVCDQYGLITDEEKRIIIRYELVNDPDFKGFNAAIMHRWFQRHMASNKGLYAQRANEGGYSNEREKHNQSYYKKQLELKRANNPQYDPVQEMKKRKPIEGFKI